MGFKEFPRPLSAVNGGTDTMLRSYQYTEKSYFEYTFQSNLFRDKQIGIARRFVDMHPIRRDMKETCPICGQAAGNYFFSKKKLCETDKIHGMNF